MLKNLINKLNDLRPRQLLMLAGGAALLLFITMYAAMSFLQAREKAEVEKKAVETVQVVVAKVNIPPRTRIQESMLQIKEMPADMLPEGIIRDFKDVLDVQVKVSIFAGDILTIQKVFAERNDEGFIATIPLDCRAVSIGVNDVTGVAGFAKPGDFVDLLLVERSQYSATTNILLQNVQLLSINKDMTGTNVVTEGAANTTTAINNPSIATFALRPEDVLKLISASKLGEIYMSLRPTKPRNSYVGEMEYTIDSINMPPPKEPVKVEREETPMPVIPSNPTPVVPLPQLPLTPKIEIIQGDQITQEAEQSVPQVVTPSANAPLPVIPSRSGVANNSGRNTSENFSSIAEPVSGTPLSNSRVAQSW